MVAEIRVSQRRAGRAGEHERGRGSSRGQRPPESSAASAPPRARRLRRALRWGARTRTPGRMLARPVIKERFRAIH